MALAADRSRVFLNKPGQPWFKPKGAQGLDQGPNLEDEMTPLSGFRLYKYLSLSLYIYIFIHTYITYMHACMHACMHLCA